MDVRKKDNLTDAVEALDRNDKPSEPQGRDQQVVNNDGEIITLGQNGGKNPTPPNKKKVIELSDKDLSEIKEIVASAIQTSLDKFFKNFRQNNPE